MANGKTRTSGLFEQISNELRRINERFTRMEAEMILMRSEMRQQGQEISLINQRCIRQLEKVCGLDNGNGDSDSGPDSNGSANTDGV